MISRRNVFAGLMAMPSLLSALTAEGEDGKNILGPAVADWDKLQFHKTATGEMAQVFKQPTATVDQLEIHVSKLNAGMASHEPHRHVNEELIIVREGDCETLSDGKWVKAGPGSIVFNASNSLHAFRNVGKTQAVYHVINWSPNKDLAAKHS
jgi:quercetin dioxygenase-like cupin family protein